MNRRSGLTLAMETNRRATEGAIRAALTRALNRIAIRWHADARLNAPVDTGRLRASIAFTTPTVRALHTETYPGSDGKPGGVISYQPPEPGDLEAAVGTNVEYAPDVHENHPTASGFIRNAAEENADLFERIVAEELARLEDGTS